MLPLPSGNSFLRLKQMLKLIITFKILLIMLLTNKIDRKLAIIFVLFTDQNKTKNSSSGVVDSLVPSTVLDGKRVTA
jgi:hypothetical protein